jgi:GAF domain-containing protein
VEITMPTRSRALTNADIAAVIALSNEQQDRQKVYKAVEKLAADTCGWVLLTTLKYVEAEQVVERVHSSDEKAYPLGGKKPLNKITASHGAMDQGDVFLAATKADVKHAFFDHELIFSLGISAILNSPIRYAGRRLGTLNFCGTEGMYGPTEIQNAKILAGLLVPSVLHELKT